MVEIVRRKPSRRDAGEWVLVTIYALVSGYMVGQGLTWVYKATVMVGQELWPALAPWIDAIQRL